LLIISIFILCDCDFGNGPEQYSLIDSLIIIEQHDYKLGDTLNIVCIHNECNDDLLQFEWSSTGGEIHAERDTVSLISTEDTSVIVICKVVNQSGDSSIQSINIHFENRIFILGHLEKLLFDENYAMAQTPYTILNNGVEMDGITDDVGDLIFSFPNLPTSFRFMVDQEGFKVDTLIFTGSLSQSASNKYERLDISSFGQIDFFPVTVGNTWTFNSLETYNAYSGDYDKYVDGIETWEIIDVNASNDTIQMLVTFNGQIRERFHNGFSTWFDTTQIDTNNIVVLMKCEKIYGNEVSFEDTFSVISWYPSNSSFFPGISLMRKGMPVIHKAKNNITFSTLSVFWEFEYGVGPLEGCYSFFTNAYELELISYDIDPLSFCDKKK
jgi:hypothetical protein